MNSRGFSLIELLTAIVLIGILSTLGTFAFIQYLKKTRITNQTRLLYGDLTEYRIKSVYEKKCWSFKISAAGYGIYSSMNTAVAPVRTVNLKYNLISDNDYDIIFDTQGIVHFSNDYNNFDQNKSACISNANDAVVDSVVISTTRVQIGKKTGVDCVAANINSQ